MHSFASNLLFCGINLKRVLWKELPTSSLFLIAMYTIIWVFDKFPNRKLSKTVFPGPVLLGQSFTFVETL